MFLTPTLVILSTLCISYAKIYERCELARELRNFDLPEDEIPTWVCIAQHESNYDTSAMNSGSGDHGLFQISQLYWCSPPGNGYGCNSHCSKFRDEDIADDLQCIRRIYNEHTRISGDGFNAWVVYPLHCKHDNYKYVQGCFDQDLSLTPDISYNATDNEIPYEEVDEYGDGYQFPPLQNFSRTDEEVLSEPLDVGGRYDFLNLPFSRISIHDSISLQDKSYNFPAFPSSKESIHEFISVNRPSKEPISKTKVKEDVDKFPIGPIFSKQSIHHFVPLTTTSKEDLIIIPKQSIDDESKYNFPSLPKSFGKTFEQPIRDSVPASKPSQKTISRTTEATKRDEVPVSSIFSKQSIHHFVPVSTIAKERLINVPKKSTENEAAAAKQNEFSVASAYFKQSSKEHLIDVPKKSTEADSEYNFPSLPKSSGQTFGQQIRGSLPVPKPSQRTISRATEAAKQNEFSVASSYSKQSSKDHIINVPNKNIEAESEYNFPSLQKSSGQTYGQQIGGSLPTQKPSQQTISRTTESVKQDEFSLASVDSKQSFKEHLINAPKKSTQFDSEYSFPSLPKSSGKPFGQPIRASIPASKSSEETISRTTEATKRDEVSVSAVYSKHESKERLINVPKKSIEVDSKSNFSFLPRSSKKPFGQPLGDSVPTLKPPKGTISHTTEAAKRDEFSVHSTQASKEHLINEPKTNTKDELEYNYSSFPKSSGKAFGQPIPDPILASKPSQKTLTGTAETSIRDEVSVPSIYSKQSSKEDLINLPKKTTDAESEYNFPALPKSFEKTFGQPIRDSISTPKPWEKTLSHTTEAAKQDSKQSITHFVPISTTLHSFVHVTTTSKEHLINVPKKSTKDESEYNFLPLPKSFGNTVGQPTRDILPPPKPAEKPISSTNVAAKQEEFSVSSIKSTQQSTHQFVPISPTPKKPVINAEAKTHKEDSNYNFPPLLKISKNTLEGSKAVQTDKITYAQELIDSGSSTKKSSTTYRPVTKLSRVTSKAISTTSKTSSQITSLKSNTVKPPSSTAESLSESTIGSYHKKALTTVQKPFARVLKPFVDRLDSLDISTQVYSTTRKLSTNKLVTTTWQPFINKLSTSNTGLKPVVLTSRPFVSAATVATTVKSITTTSKRDYSAFSPKSVTNSLKLSTFTVRPSIESSATEKAVSRENLGDYDLQGASSTLTPFAAFKPISTTLKPTQKASFATQKSTITTTKKSFSPAANSVPTPSTKKPFIYQSYSTSKPVSTSTYKSLLTAAPKQFDTTSKPSAKQLTFAPDSFFSWVFGSQTLPPLVPPVRPPRPSRPPGERPGGLPTLPTRPSVRPSPERPSGLPRPPRPQRPSRIRPHIAHSRSFESEEVSDTESKFGKSSTRRPSSLSPFIRTSLSEQRPGPSTRTSLTPFITSTPKTFATKKVVPSAYQGSVFGVKQSPGNVDLSNSAGIKKLPNSFGKLGSEPGGDDHAVEVKLDDNFVFLRTRFGYRLFKKN